MRVRSEASCAETNFFLICSTRINGLAFATATREARDDDVECLLDGLTFELSGDISGLDIWFSVLSLGIEPVKLGAFHFWPEGLVSLAREDSPSNFPKFKQRLQVFLLNPQ
jgi:hypothetical protein